MSTLDHLPKSVDVVVVGARCAGASTAMLLARSGLEVLAVDQGSYGSDTLSTHALMRAGVAQLTRWGLLERVRRMGAAPIRRVSFHYGEEVIDVRIKPLHGVEALYAPRRMDLDRMLVDAACEAGADVRHHVKLVELGRSPSGAVTGVVLADDGNRRRVEVKTRLVVGADGRRSRVAAQVQAPVHHWGQHACGLVYGHFTGLALDGYRWYYRPEASVGVIPSRPGEACIFVSVRASRHAAEFGRNPAEGFFRILERAAPDMAERLAGSMPIKGFRSFLGHRSYLRRSWGDGWALVGDAGYFKDPLTAHGMTDAFVDAELLARAVMDGKGTSLAGYQRTRDAVSLGLLEVTDAIASFDWDLETLKSHHRALSEAMGRKLAEVMAFDDPSFRAA